MAVYIVSSATSLFTSCDHIGLDARVAIITSACTYLYIYMPGVLWRMYLPPGPMASLTANNHIALYCHSGPWRDMTRSGSEKSGSRESCTGPCSTAQASSLCTLKVCW